MSASTVPSAHTLLLKNTTDELIDKVETLGVTWAELDSAASMLEETKKTYFHKILQTIAAGYTKTPAMAALESLAYSDERYLAHVESMVAARRDATKARARYDMGKARLDMLRTQMATARQEMAMSGMRHTA